MPSEGKGWDAEEVKRTQRSGNIISFLLCTTCLQTTAVGEREVDRERESERQCHVKAKIIGQSKDHFLPRLMRVCVIYGKCRLRLHGCARGRHLTGQLRPH